MGSSIGSTGVRAYLVGSIAAKISSASSSPEAAAAVRFVHRDREQRRTRWISGGILSLVLNIWGEQNDRDFRGEFVACRRFSSFPVEETERRSDPTPENCSLKACVRRSTLRGVRGSAPRRK